MSRAAIGSVPSEAGLIVFYDGLCPFCHASVRWLLARDRRGHFHFAPLQGETARAVRDAAPEALPAGDASMILVDLRCGGACARQRSDAVLAVLRELGAPWSWLCLLRWLPAGFRDRLYDLFASRRYRLFGRYPDCRIPESAERARLLP